MSPMWVRVEEWMIADARADWTVADVPTLPNGGVIVDLTRARHDERRAA